MSCESAKELEERNDALMKKLAKLEVDRERWIKICARASQPIKPRMWLIDCQFDIELMMKQVKKLEEDINEQ
jgi:hypothetical protein